jgi:hypothetical protein
MSNDTDYPLINGRAFEGASVKIKMLGQYFRGIQSITYGDALEPNYVYELGSVAPIAMTRGQYKPDDIALEVIRERADAIRAAAASSGTAWGLVPFTITIHYDEPGNSPVTDVIFGSRVTKVANDAKAGPDTLVEKWSLKPMTLKRNGSYLYK